MPLSPAVLTASFLANQNSGPFSFNGPAFPPFCTALGNAIYSWAVGQPQNILLNGVSTGLVGAGTILVPSSVVIVPPNPALIQAALSGSQYNGPLAPSLASVISSGLSQAFVQANYTGVVGGVGSGQDISHVVLANPATLIPLMLAQFSSLLGQGPLALNLATGISIGIANLLLTATATGTVVGGSAPFPASGTSISTLL